MPQSAEHPTEPARARLATGAAPSPVEVASHLAARLCHDFMSPASGIVSGLDLLADPASADLHAEAHNLITASARKLIDLLTFSRAAFGPTADIGAVSELEALARGVIAHGRAELDWAVEAREIDPLAGQVLLNLVQIAATALPTGGQVRVTSRIEGAWTAVQVEALSARARLHEEIRAGFRGEALGEGLGGRWIQAWRLSALVAQAGGVLAAEPGASGVTFRAALPA